MYVLMSHVWYKSCKTGCAFDIPGSVHYHDQQGHC